MSYASTVLADGAVGYWRLGEALFASAAADAKGNQNGVYTNATGITLGQTGIPGGGGGTACRFTAANSGYVAIADTAAQHTGDVWTIEAWIKIAGTGAGYYIFAGAANNQAALSLGTQNPPLLATVKIGITALVQSTTGVPADGSFHHVAGTKNGAANKVYIDGVDASGSVTNSTTSNSTGLNIGRQSTGTYLDSTAGEVALYPTALSSAKILTHYRLGANLAPVNTVAPVASGATTVGSVVSSTTGTWSDAGSPTFTYQWQRDVLGNGVYSNIATATASSYTLVILDDACNVRCVVTDTDVVGATSANSNSILDTTPAAGNAGSLLPLLGVG